MRENLIIRKLYGIQKRLLVYTMILILIVLLLAAMSVSWIVGENIKENLAERYGYINDKFYTALERMYVQLEAITESCITNNNVQNSLKNKQLSAYDKEVISRTLQFVDEGYVQAYLYMDNKDNIYTRSSSTLNAETIKNSYLYQNMGDDYSKVKLFWGQDILSEGEENVLYAGRYVRQFERNYNPGVIYLQLDNTIFSYMVAETDNYDPAYFVLDNIGKICFQTYPESTRIGEKDKASIEETIQRIYGEQQGNGEPIITKKGLFYIKTQEESGFSVVTFVPNAIVYKSIWQTIWVISLIFVFVLILAFFFSRSFAKQFTMPIRYISSLMENFDNAGLYCPVNLYTNTELDDIGNSYNKMLGRISDLIEEVTFKERELRKAELDTLMYQIQPHFLYNTLDTVYMLARISKEKTIMQMIQALSKYLRINLSNGAEEIKIQEELEHVKAYLDIQKIRKSDMFSYEIFIEEALKNISVIKMILQPIVENCIKHAFEEEEEDLKIWITVKEENENILFIVQNNGKLMSDKAKERLNRLESVEIESIDSVVTKGQGGFGVWNVVKRLRLRYQEQIHFQYSVMEQRTCCMIKIKKAFMKVEE